MARLLPPLPRARPIEGNEVFAEIELSEEVRRHLQPVEYRGDSPMKGRLFTIPMWEKWSMEQRIAFLRLFVEDKARDPMIARKATQIIREARVPLKDHRGEWEALLRWTQRNIRFTAEPKERIQSGQFTLTERYGDCDDCAGLLATLGWSLRLDFRFVLLGRNDKGKRVQWIEGRGPCPKDVNWTHIYCLCGFPTFRPTQWLFGEPTLDVKLGYDPFKEGVPKERKDLGSGAFLFRRSETGAVKGGETAIQKIKAHAAKVNWYSVAGTVIGGLASALLLRAFLGHRKSRRKR